MIEAKELLPSALAATGATLGSLLSYLQFRARMERLERRLTKVFRLLLDNPALTPAQRALVEELLKS